jgi:hypothetical protein
MTVPSSPGDPCLSFRQCLKRFGCPGLPMPKLAASFGMDCVGEAGPAPRETARGRTGRSEVLGSRFWQSFIGVYVIVKTL